MRPRAARLWAALALCVAPLGCDAPPPGAALTQAAPDTGADPSPADLASADPSPDDMALEEIADGEDARVGEGDYTISLTDDASPSDLDLAMDLAVDLAVDLAPEDAPAEAEDAPTEVEDAPAEVEDASEEIEDAPEWACAPLGGSCAQVERAAQEHFIEPIDGCRFALAAPTRTGRAAIDALVARAGGALGLEDVLGALNREGAAGISAEAAERLQNHRWQGFRWNRGDGATADWYPQGVTSTSDAFEGERLAGRRALLVSWYHKTEARPTKGARVTLVDITALERPRYRHLLLVEPRLVDGVVQIDPAEYDGGGALHAGGIVWYGDYLFVADTSRGLRVFDLRSIIRVSHVDDSDRVGVSPGRIDAHGYRYAIPQLARYTLAEGSCPLRFSSVGLDRGADPPQLITAEYRANDHSGRVVAWPLDPRTGLLEERQGQVRAARAWVGAQSRMQGALTWAGDVYISSSSQVSGGLGRLYRAREGQQSSISAWPYGCEDLTYERREGLIWTVTEHPDRRDVVAIPRRPPASP